MAKATWAQFPYADPGYAYPGRALQQSWERLHRGDCEPWPREARLQEAWRLYHAGAFQRAAELGAELGGGADRVAIKATVIYATYLERSAPKKLKLFQQAMELGEQAIAARPDDAHAQYFYALAAGRYSQGISVAKALAAGLGGRIKAALDRALAGEPKHADAHIALGTWHAEIINKVGALVAGLTYGADKEAAQGHFKRALKLNPASAIARIEYANGLALMFGKARLTEAEKLYGAAAQCEAADAMERLDVEFARTETSD
jgi:tetratricopeptide (TPR) repeat protein